MQIFLDYLYLIFNKLKIRELNYGLNCAPKISYIWRNTGLCSAVIRY